MGQEVKALPAEASCGEAVMGIDWEEPMCVLVRHCRDMKREETRLRLITLLLFLSCSAFYIFTTCADLRRREPPAAGEHLSSGERQAANPCPERQSTTVSSRENPQDSKKFHIHLRSLFVNTRSEGQLVKWSLYFSSNMDYDECKQAVVIPENGLYFFYLRIPLSCHTDTGAASFNQLTVSLNKWNKGYNSNNSTVLIEARDGTTCPSEEFRTVFVGELLELERGDHVIVWIRSGYELIDQLTLGAYLV